VFFFVALAVSVLSLLAVIVCLMICLLLLPVRYFLPVVCNVTFVGIAACGLLGCGAVDVALLQLLLLLLLFGFAAFTAVAVALPVC